MPEPFHTTNEAWMAEREGQDRSLVEAALRGDRRAFEGLVERHQRLVAGVAWRYGVAPAEIEDVVSETFVKAYRKLSRYRPDHPFSTWLYRLAVNHVIDHQRRTRRHRHQEQLSETLRDPGGGASEALEERERRDLIRSALLTLKPHFRDALFLVYIEGMKVDQAARLLGLPTGTIKTRLMRGREALRRTLLTRHPEHFGGAS